jgi:hypothetical protein
MAIDIRATVTCSLGTLISANVSDDYIQGTGLIKTRGSCEISGLVNPEVGQVVTFNYTKSGLTRSVPRKLRVLSSFADPFRRTTKVELGCKLTYLSDLKDPIKWNAYNDPENVELDRNDGRIVILPIYASSIMVQCLTALGITASSVPLTNRFSIEEFDFGSGYVQTLGDLLVSESFCGYLDFTEKLQIFSLNAMDQAGPLLDSGKLIDVGPIGVGDLPGDTVVVSYNTLKLKAPDDTEVVCRNADDEPEEDEDGNLESKWGNDLTTSTSVGRATYAYKLPGNDTLLQKSYSWQESATEVTYYALYDVYESGKVKRALTVENGSPWPAFDSPIDGKVVERRNLVATRTVTQRTGSTAVAGGYAQQSLSNGFDYNNYDVFKTTTEQFAYDDSGNETSRISETIGSEIFLYGSAGIDFFYTDENGTTVRVAPAAGTAAIERLEVYSTTTDNFTKTVTKRYGPWADTISGQQAIANAREYITTVAQAEDFLNRLFGGLYLIDVTIETSVTGGRGSQELPSEEEAVKEELVEDTGDPDNGFTTESKAQLELVTGSASAVRRIELSMPYAPDDTFRRETVDTDPLRYCYYSVGSDASAKADRYGRAQNRILFGNRNGMNIQTAPESLPTTPFAPLYISANGTITQYRLNGTNWTMDASGIVASTDALYWGVAGKSA